MAAKRKTELDIDLTAQLPVIEEKEEPLQPPPELAAEPEPRPSGEPAEKKPSRLKLYVSAGLVSAAALLSAVTLAVYLGGEKKPVAEKEEIVVEGKEFPPSEQVKVVNNLPLEPFILPVEHKDGKGFLRIKYSLLLSNIDAVAEVEENLPLMRETIYLFTKGRKPDDFAAPGKKDETVAALKRLLNRYIQNGRVDNIMITEFTVF